MGKIKLLVFLFFSIWIHSQKYSVVYELSFQPNKEDTIKEKELVELYIDTDMQTSFFRNVSLKEKPAFNYQVYKDFKKGLCYRYESLISVMYKTKCDLLKNWKITSDVKEVLGYRVRRATIDLGGRIWEAWYAVDIPIFDGVYRFSGLPGLILEVSDNEKEYNFRLNSISKTDDKIKLSNSVKLLSLEELNKLKVKIYKDPAGILRQKLATMSSEGMSIGVKFNGESISNKDLVERMESDYLEFFRKYNNPLEKNDIWLR